MELNNIINQKVIEFQKRLSSKSDAEKKLFHYNSVLNISQRIVLHQDEKADLLKEKLIIFFEELNGLNYLINNKLESAKLYRHLLLIDKYLFKEENFLTNNDLQLLIIIGSIIDIALYFLVTGYYYPIFIILFFIFGIYRRKKAKREGKYAAMFW